MSFDLVEKLGKPPPKPSDKKEPRKPVEADDDGNDDRKLSPSREDQRRRLQERFQLVKSISRHGVYFGVYDADRHTQELISTDRQEALEEIDRRIDAELMEHIPSYPTFRTGLAA
jgi:hypothetical protein